MNRYYICETVLETNIADTVYRYIEREDDGDEWVEDFQQVLYDFDRAHENDSDTYGFEFYLNDRTGNIEFQAWFKSDVNDAVPTIVKSEIEDMAQDLIEQLNRYLAKNRLCQIPKDTNLLYHNGNFYVPIYKSEARFDGTEPIYIREDFYDTDVEWYGDEY